MQRTLDRSRAPAPSPGAERPETLTASDLSVAFSGVKALESVHLEVRRGEILGLIGPNGAGKTTLVNALSGYVRPQSGRVTFGSEDITGWPPARLARLGLARTFQNVRLFAGLSTADNLRVAAFAVGARKAEATDLTRSLLARFGLTKHADMLAQSLSYGDARWLGIARALATRPSFLLLDEPGAGLNEQESDQLLEALNEVIKDFDCGLLIIDHDMRLIMSLCPNIQVLDHGLTIAMGTPAEIRINTEVLKAYIGSERA